MDKPHIYKITNNINGKFYYGVHDGSNTENYQGSGVALEKAIEKYGWDNFNKEILLWFDTTDEAYEYEEVIVNQDMVNNPMSYNIKKGGIGGWDYVNKLGIKGMKGKKHSEETKALLRKRRAEIDTPEYRKKLSDALKGKPSGMEGKKHSEEVKEKIKASTKNSKSSEKYKDIARRNVEKSMKSGKHISKQKVKCIHCGKESVPGNIARWHNDNCKHKENK